MIFMNKIFYGLTILEYVARFILWMILWCATLIFNDDWRGRNGVTIKKSIDFGFIPFCPPFLTLIILPLWINKVKKIFAGTLNKINHDKIKVVSICSRTIKK